ncbi:DUF5818 domain-containing protein [Sphingosinicella humi]|uniref:Uncharacterized protein n=1 Tax=Allosphingosinicella humi TaxID=2068657 RepID=A0A2U2J594_9SPHN|nr:DUF5818 domain-containing protein [Sphingosinicella humi]PWG03504.1 hypothetical protein DF286_11950 [Sphingosinicella humi]
MSIGSFHSETGLLLRQRGWLILQRDEGGRWRLEVSASFDDLLGSRVRVEGTRIDFDILEVARISPC